MTEKKRPSDYTPEESKAAQPGWVKFLGRATSKVNWKSPSTWLVIGVVGVTGWNTTFKWWMPYTPTYASQQEALSACMSELKADMNSGSEYSVSRFWESDEYKIRSFVEAGCEPSESKRPGISFYTGTAWWTESDREGFGKPTMEKVNFVYGKSFRRGT